jgi:hypothetical protein
VRFLLLLLLALAPAAQCFASAGEYAAASDVDVLAAAERAFAEGVGLKSDAVKARAAFARAAAAYDELWRRGHHNPTLALNQATSRRLAGDLPGAIVAFHDGLAVARHDRALRLGLEDARSAVAYPLDGDLARQCRPRLAATIGARMAPAEAFALAGGLWLVACLAVARYFMSRAGGWLGLAGLAAAALLALGGLWWHDALRADPRPRVVVAADAVLRKGNADAYPPRLEAKLPRGVEARELGRRGGWVQVELAGGAVGWLPEAAVLASGGR